MAATLPVTRMEPSDVAAAGFLARYREPTLSVYRRDLRCFWQWCADHQLEPLAVRRPHPELYLRELEQLGYPPFHRQPPAVHRRGHVQVRGHRRACRY